MGKLYIVVPLPYLFSRFYLCHYGSAEADVMVGGFFYVLKGVTCTEVRCRPPKWHWCQSFSDAYHTVPHTVMGILLSLVVFFFSFALLVCFAALVCWVTFSDSDAKYARVVLHLEKTGKVWNSTGRL